MFKIPFGILQGLWLFLAVVAILIGCVSAYIQARAKTDLDIRKGTITADVAKALFAVCVTVATGVISGIIPVLR